MRTQQRDSKRLPRRRAAFADMTPETVREIARQVVNRWSDSAGSVR